MVGKRQGRKVGQFCKSIVDKAQGYKATSGLTTRSQLPQAHKVNNPRSYKVNKPKGARLHIHDIE